MKPLPRELQPLFSAAYDALFAIEQALSPNSSNDDRRAVFRARAAVGDVENALRARQERVENPCPFVSVGGHKCSLPINHPQTLCRAEDGTQFFGGLVEKP